MALLAASASLSSLSLRCAAQASASAPSGTHSARVASVAPASTPFPSKQAAAAAPCGRVSLELGSSALAGAVFAALASSDSAVAAQEVMDLAAADNDSRGLLVLLVLVPAVGWVLFNILRPALSQLDRMNAAKGVVGAVGMAGALLLCTPQAQAAVQEMAAMADGAAGNSDARGLVLFAALVPALGWVLFNILQPALNQLDRMKTSKGVAAAVGLGAASVLLPMRADALQELASIADNDSRGTLLLAVLIPAIGWVLFNILQPALTQFDKMKAQK